MPAGTDTGTRQELRLPRAGAVEGSKPRGSFAGERSVEQPGPVSVLSRAQLCKCGLGSSSARASGTGTLGSFLYNTYHVHSYCSLVDFVAVPDASRSAFSALNVIIVRFCLVKQIQ